MKFNITIDVVGLGNFANGQALTEHISLAVSKALVLEDVLVTRVDMREGGASSVSPTRRNASTPGRKPVNRPKVEAWIREHIPVGESNLGTLGLEGVDGEGKPLKNFPNRIFPHRLAAPAPEGVGLSLTAIDKVLRELEVGGYLSRGFAAGAPFYELIRPLEQEGMVGVRGKIDQPATILEIDFSNVKDN